MQKLKTINAPSVIQRLEELKRTTRITLANLVHLEKLNTTPTIGLLAKMSCVSDRTINRELAELEEKGYITRVTKYLNGKGRQTTISILWNKIKSQAKDYDWYEEKQEIKNKAVLTTQNNSDDNLYQPDEESGLNSLKMGNNEEFEIDTKVEQINDEIYMGNPTNIIIKDNKAIEINERKSIPTVKINNTNVKPAKNTPSFQDVFKAYSNHINDIINDFKDGSPLRKMQGETRMSELLNTRAGKIYREEIVNLINERVKSSIIEQGISPVEQVQELINNDDNFYRVFTNCVKMLSSDEPQESATNKLISLFNEYNVPYNKQVRDFIAEEIYYHINNKNEYAA